MLLTSGVRCHTREFFLFFFNDTATTEIYTLSLHDALPICRTRSPAGCAPRPRARASRRRATSQHRPPPASATARSHRSEEHTSELQSRLHLVCRLLLEKKNGGRPGNRQPGDHAGLGLCT